VIEEADKMIVGLGSQAGVGKDYAAQVLIQKWGSKNARRIAFADELKADLFTLIWEKTGINVFLCTPEEKEIVRPFLVAYGEMMRAINANYWVDRAWATIGRHDDPVTVITDCRYPNEVETVKARGGVYIDIETDKAPANASEAENAPLCRAMADRVVKNNFDEKFAVEFLEAVESL
jgi:hypothetical protein